MNIQTKQQLLQHLLQFVSENKQALFHRIIQHRMRYLTVAIEDVFQPHNASAVLRSCDCFGVQDVHIIENRNQYEVNPKVAMGASKWITMHRYNAYQNNTLQCFRALREQGYRIVATTPHENDCMIHELPVNSKIALVFGTELDGLSDLALKEADAFVSLPMYGFTESFNVSVSAALAMYHITEKIRRSDVPWQLTEEEKLNLMLDWVRKVVKSSDVIEREFVQNKLEV